jgi:hypothetical protein
MMLANCQFQVIPNPPLAVTNLLFAAVSWQLWKPLQRMITMQAA